jgi:hypothetical protein
MKSWGLGALILLWAAGAWAGGAGQAVDVEIRSDGGRLLPLYPVSGVASGRRLYAEAVKGERYTILVRNRLDRRIGVVVAVDGRNIISGRRSWLKSDERMYVLEPYAQGEFSGWRTSLESVNRFYFTEADDSYAAAFHDETAMGVIAVAAYPEVPRREEPAELQPAVPRSLDRAAPSTKAESERAGTGYGPREHSPVRVVAFEPEKTAADRFFIKYEWRSVLCRQGIIRSGCSRPPRNRFWDEGEFAPPPPGRS